MMFPTDWYWVADDGRVYSSARQAAVDTADPGYIAAAESGQTTRWPLDLNGDQTNSELDSVLEPYGLSVSGERPAKLSFLEFMDLFTEAEQLAIKSASMADAAIGLWYDRALGADFIDMGDERLAAGLQAFVTAGLLTSARSNRVLKGLPPA